MTAILSYAATYVKYISADKTHVLVAKPEISVRYLADFMAASERKRRSIVSGCKFRPIARVLQHQEAQISIAKAFVGGAATKEALKAKADFIRKKIPTNEFDSLVNDTNADYVTKFSEVVDGVVLPKAEILPGKKYPALSIHGVRIRFTPNLLFRQTTGSNVVRKGALMLRYAKGNNLNPEVGGFQSAAIFGLLSEFPDEEATEIYKPICLTLDAVAGVLYPAPSKSVTFYANMKAACQTIAERWPNIEPPTGAVL